MTLVVLGHASDNGNFQQGAIARERAFIIMLHREKNPRLRGSVSKDNWMQ